MRRSGWLVMFGGVIAVAGCGSGVDTAKFDSLHKASIAITAKADAGMTADDLRKEVQNLAVELKAAEAKATNETEKAIVAKYREAYEILKDSSTLLEAETMLRKRIKSYSGAIPIDARGAERLGIETAEYAQIAERHDLPTEIHGGTSNWLKPGAVQLLWEKADAKIVEASALVK